MSNAVPPPPAASVANDEVSEIKPILSEPPQVRAINALGAALVLVLSQFAELGLMGIASFMFWHGKIGEATWIALAAAPIVGPGIAKARGKSIMPTTALVLGFVGGKAGMAGALGAAASRMQSLALIVALSLGLSACAAIKPIVRTVADIAHELCLLTAAEQGALARDGLTVEQFCAVETNVRPFVEQILAAKQAAAAKAGLAPPTDAPRPASGPGEL